MRNKSSPTVVLGLSSGVDSSVAAWLLKEQGYNVVGVTLALAEPQDGLSSRSCCSPSLMARAKAVADHLLIPHYALDFRSEFKELVIDYFVSAYAAGMTPNPCAKCNSRLRFRALEGAAERLGAQYIATGHYARLVGEEKRLARGVDPSKDQSYVLGEVEPELLEKSLLPLGSLTKDEVRCISDDIGLAGLVSTESQDICFVPRGGYREFLQERLGERPGVIVDDQGHEVASHSGTYRFTIGQKRGLGHAGGRTLYVSGVDVARHQVRVAEKDRARTRSLRFSVSARHSETPEGRIRVQIRSAGEALSGKLVRPDTILLDEGEIGVAPGQTVVIYDEDKVVLGGTILSTGSSCQVS